MAKGLAKEQQKKDRESRLQQAIANDDVAELHNLIGEERQLLDRLSKDPFPNTPLHLAAAAGKTSVAIEMAILKPSFTRKLNSEGYSPMHLALQHQQYHTARALKTFNPKLIRVRGRCGITPLHYIVEKEDKDLDLLAEFLFACRSSIKDLTSRGETAAHLAVKNDNFGAFEVLFGWLKRVSLTEILNWKDEDGNNVLHIVASKKQFEIIKSVIKYTDVDAKNSQGKTALDIFKENHCSNEDIEKRLHPKRCSSSRTPLSLSEFFKMELTGLEKYEFFFGFEDERARDIILVVATLIATATYQAALTPPGGYWQDSYPSPNPSADSAIAIAANSNSTGAETPHQAGDIIMNGWSLYFFSVVNSMAFFTSIGTIWASAIPLLPRTNMVCIAMVILGTAFSYSLVSQFPKSEALPANILGGFYVSLVVAGLVVPVIVWKRHAQIVNRIDFMGRRIDTFLGSKAQKC
ncbi:hypothetical protein BT93_D0796 [Corymbia citriodora subsp. variegata]|nr:hypothetical protein BT93_D0796 [Corymbia citriodora subsp. variegata]